MEALQHCWLSLLLAGLATFVARQTWKVLASTRYHPLVVASACLRLLEVLRDSYSSTIRKNTYGVCLLLERVFECGFMESGLLWRNGVLGELLLARKLYSVIVHLCLYKTIR